MAGYGCRVRIIDDFSKVIQTDRVVEDLGDHAGEGHLESERVGRDEPLDEVRPIMIEEKPHGAPEIAVQMTGQPMQQPRGASFAPVRETLAETEFTRESGAAWGTRTHDPIITNDVLYQLS